MSNTILSFLVFFCFRIFVASLMRFTLGLRFSASTSRAEERASVLGRPCRVLLHYTTRESGKQPAALKGRRRRDGQCPSQPCESGGHFPACPLGPAGPTVSLITQVMGTSVVVRVSSTRIRIKRKKKIQKGESISCSVMSKLFATPWTTARRAPLSVEFSRQEYWSGLPCPLPGDLPQPGIKSAALESPALADRFFTSSTTWEALRKPVSLFCFNV